MAEAGRPWLAWAWLALGLALSATLLLAHPAAVVGAWLAQPALALGLSRLRGLRPALPVPVLQRDFKPFQRIFQFTFSIPRNLIEFSLNSHLHSDFWNVWQFV